MSNRRKSKPAKRGRPRNVGTPPHQSSPELQPSLPPAGPDATLRASTSDANSVPTEGTSVPVEGTGNEFWRLPVNSKVRTVAMQIVALRLAGKEDPEIAQMLGISPKTISGYVYRASKNGWLDTFNSAKEEIQNRLVHKVIRNLDEALDSGDVLQTGMKSRTAVALKVAEGTVFKEFGEGNTSAVVQQMALSITIEQPKGAEGVKVREGTVGGVPSYVEAETVESHGSAEAPME